MREVTGVEECEIAISRLPEKWIIFHGSHNTTVTSIHMKSIHHITNCTQCDWNVTENVRHHTNTINITVYTVNDF